MGPPADQRRETAGSDVVRQGVGDRTDRHVRIGVQYDVETDVVGRIGRCQCQAHGRTIRLDTDITGFIPDTGG